MKSRNHQKNSQNPRRNVRENTSVDVFHKVQLGFGLGNGDKTTQSCIDLQRVFTQFINCVLLNESIYIETTILPNYGNNKYHIKSIFKNEQVPYSNIVKDSATLTNQKKFYLLKTMGLDFFSMLYDKNIKENLSMHNVLVNCCRQKCTSQSRIKCYQTSLKKIKIYFSFVEN